MKARRTKVQLHRRDWEDELLELALATEQVAGRISDPAIATRLRTMAEEVRAMTGHGSEASGALSLPA
jgi:hypothetical protein